MMQYHLDSRLIEEMIHEHHLLVLDTKNNAEMKEHYCVLCCQNPQLAFAKTMAISILRDHFTKNSWLQGLKKNPTNQVSFQIQLHKTCIYSNVSIFLYSNIIQTCDIDIISDQDFKPPTHVNPLAKKSINVIAKRKFINMLC